MEAYREIILLLAATIRVATPLVLAAWRASSRERSGVIDLGLEGKMLGAAFASAAVSAATGSAWLGLGAGVAAGSAPGLVIAFACVTHRGNQVVAAMAINIMVAGLAPALALAWFDQGGQTPQLDGPGQRFLGLAGPGAQAARRHPFPGLAYAELLSGHSLIVYFAAALVPASAWVLYRTRFGLRLRAVGENPARRGHGRHLRRRAALPGVDDLRGVLCGVAGTYLSTAASAGIRARHDGGQGLPRPRGPDLRQMAALSDAGRLPPLRLCGRRGGPAAGRRAAGRRGRAGPIHHRACPMS
jgi:ABC-type uncharacterized transport system permease subunit